jgi:GTPase SAR1 family protein
LSFFDIVGQERSRILSRTYYKGAAGCFVMFDVTNPGTLEGAQTWKKDLDEKVILPSGSPVPSVLLANKCDLAQQRAISEEEIAAFAEKHDFIGWKEISVKENRNISEAVK